MGSFVYVARETASGREVRSSVEAATEQAAPLATSAAGETLAWGDAHREQLRDFIRCCRTGATPLVDGREGRNAVELVLAVYAAARRAASVDG